MARLNVNPTRMELTRLKRRLKTAARGHKLLKDKRDELMRQFLEHVYLNKELRIKVEEALKGAYGGFAASTALMSAEMMQQSFLYPKQEVSLSVSYQNIMSVGVPVYKINTKTDEASDIFPYSFLTTPGELDASLLQLQAVINDMLRLAEVEKTIQLLAEEIEKTRRRVNALEHVMIPQLEETIKYISMKLDENERSSLTRLMKVKELVLEQSHDFH